MHTHDPLEIYRNKSLLRELYEPKRMLSGRNAYHIEQEKDKRKKNGTREEKDRVQQAKQINDSLP